MEKLLFLSDLFTAHEPSLIPKDSMRFKDGNSQSLNRFESLGDRFRFMGSR
jgi:hypothetical protein